MEIIVLRILRVVLPKISTQIIILIPPIILINDKFNHNKITNNQINLQIITIPNKDQSHNYLVKKPHKKTSESTKKLSRTKFNSNLPDKAQLIKAPNNSPTPKITLTASPAWTAEKWSTLNKLTDTRKPVETRNSRSWLNSSRLIRNSRNWWTCFRN